MTSLAPVMEAVSKPKPMPMRKNGKNWHAPRAPSRLLTSASASRTAKAHRAFKERMAKEAARKATKDHETALKDEKEAERQRRVAAIKEKREKKAEKERWDALQAKMGQKRAERKRRREHRNSLLKS